MVKVGKELFGNAGPSLVETLVSHDFKVFLDLKFHDIPNTVARACQAVAKLGVWMINVHTQGGAAMLSAAREALDQLQQPPLLVGVTMLTSFQDSDLPKVGLSGSVADNVVRLAQLAADSQLDGVVCSSHEIELLRARHNNEFLLVTPGIRPAGAPLHDQKRVMTPPEAVKLGSSYLVIGRPITEASDPLQALHDIEQSLVKL
jgi:orotidine-5'-phosphate decarboxylase